MTLYFIYISCYLTSFGCLRHSILRRHSVLSSMTDAGRLSDRNRPGVNIRLITTLRKVLLHHSNFLTLRKFLNLHQFEYNECARSSQNVRKYIFSVKLEYKVKIKYKPSIQMVLTRTFGIQSETLFKRKVAFFYFSITYISEPQRCIRDERKHLIGCGEAE